MTEQASWWLKLERAKDHLEEIKGKLREYADSHPYEAVRGRQLKKKPHVRRYLLRITEQPDPVLTVILGEFLYDLRSALDHVAVAMAPRNRRYQASFPILRHDIWEKDRWGNFIHPDKSRESFDSTVKGMDPDAIALLKQTQPYNLDHPTLAALYILSSLENADKHRNLIALTSGLSECFALVTARSDTLLQTPPGFREDGAEVAVFSWQKTWNPADLTDSEVDVQIRGTAAVTIKVVQDNGHFPLPDSLDIILEDVRGIIPIFEPFALK